MADPDLAPALLREASLELARLRRVRGAYRTTWRRIAKARRRLALAAALLAGPGIAEPAFAIDPLFRHGFLFDDSAIPYSIYHRAPAFVDIDGDGDLDMVLGFDSGLAKFDNTGSATAPSFTLGAPGPLPLLGSYEVSPAFADIDGDGDLDLLAGERYGRTLFSENTGTAAAPAFAAALTDPFGLADVGDTSRPAFVDIDADGDLDAFIGDYGGSTIFFQNTGTASTPAFAAPQTNPFGLAAAPSPYSAAAPTFADLDGDGDLDALVGGLDLRVFQNTGNASAPAFAAPEVDPFGLDSRNYQNAAAVADVDGDGDLDAMLGGRYGNVVAFENTGDASTPAFTGWGNPFQLPLTHGFVDLDADGDLDSFYGEDDGDFVLLANTGTANAPSFAPGVTNPFGLAKVLSFAAPAFADLDADGDDDAWIGETGGNTIFFQNTGTANAPSFAAPVTNPFGLTDVGNRAWPTFVDLDGDGDLDAWIAEINLNTRVFMNTGTASAPAFAAPSSALFGLPASRRRPAFVDVDGDGDVDAFISTATSPGTVFFRNTGTVTAPAFGAAQTNPFGLTNVARGLFPSLVDIDADGDLDGFVGAIDGAILFENVLIDPDACSDGLDNDGDGRIDLGNDPGCASTSDTSELGTKQCDNGLDDDADGKIDWRGDASGDPECSGLLDDRELPSPPPGPGCGIGPELLLLGPLLAAVRRRRGSYTAPSCPSPTPPPTSSSSADR